MAYFIRVSVLVLSNTNLLLLGHPSLLKMFWVLYAHQMRYWQYCFSIVNQWMSELGCLAVLERPSEHSPKYTAWIINFNGSILKAGLWKKVFIPFKSRTGYRTLIFWKAVKQMVYIPYLQWSSGNWDGGLFIRWLRLSWTPWCLKGCRLKKDSAVELGKQFYLVGMLCSPEPSNTRLCWPMQWRRKGGTFFLCLWCVLQVE